MSETLSLTRARSLWWERQGLGDDAIAEDVARAIGVTGWPRVLGTADVYIAARARCPGMTRAELDAAVARGDLRVMPTHRSLVPARFVADLFALAAARWRTTETTSFTVIESAATAVLDVLAQPMTADAIRAAVPDAALALRLLELEGRVERVLEDGRLDHDRYLWRKAQWVTPRAASTPAAQLAHVVEAFLDFAGPSTVAHIAAWTGCSPRELAPVLASLGAEPVTIDGLGPAFAQRGDIDCAHEAMLPLGVRLLGAEDNYLVNHGGLAAVTDPKHHAVAAELPRTIVVDGLVAGFWEIDPRAHAAVWTTFDTQKAAVVEKIEAKTAEMAAFLLEDVRADQDGVQARADKIRAMREARGRAA